MRLLITKSADFDVIKGEGSYEAGEWYDNVPLEHAEQLLAASAAVEVVQFPCRCLMTKDGNKLVRHGRGCEVHRTPAPPTYGPLRMRE